MVAMLADGPAPRAFRPQDWPAPPCAPFDQPKGQYCVIHVGASSRLKIWNPERWFAVAEELAQRGLQVVWSAGRGEEREVAAIDPEAASLPAPARSISRNCGISSRERACC